MQIRAKQFSSWSQNRLSLTSTAVFGHFDSLALADYSGRLYFVELRLSY